MSEYHKINSMFRRDPADRNRLMIDERAWATDSIGYLAGNEWVFTEKVDGTNIRLYFDGSEDWADNAHAHIAGRTDKASIPPKLLDRLVRMLKHREDKFRTVFPGATPVDSEGWGSVVLYGEGYGPGIQKGGGLYRDEPDFVLFDVSVGPYTLSRANVEDIGDKLAIDVVPEVGRGTLADAIELVRTNGFGSAWGGVKVPEGLVCFPSTYLADAKGDRIITKIKAKDFR